MAVRIVEWLLNTVGKCCPYFAVCLAIVLECGRTISMAIHGIGRRTQVGAVFFVQDGCATWRAWVGSRVEVPKDIRDGKGSSSGQRRGAQQSQSSEYETGVHCGRIRRVIGETTLRIIAKLKRKNDE